MNTRHIFALQIYRITEFCLVGIRKCGNQHFEKHDQTANHLDYCAQSSIIGSPLSGTEFPLCAVAFSFLGRFCADYPLSEGSPKCVGV